VTGAYPLRVSGMGMPTTGTEETTDGSRRSRLYSIGEPI
jgi:hypothetical protein